MLRLTSWAGVASVAFLAGMSIMAAPGVARAQTVPPAPPAPAASAPEPTASALVAARELFREAGQDADAGKFGLALEKYRRVAAVKETGQVRFNVARCEEQLGQIASALADYELVERDMRDAHGDADAELRNNARDRGNALRPRVPRLTLLAPLPEPPSFVVRLDGAVVSDAALGVPLPVDPGRHRVEASAGGRVPLTRELEVREKEVTRVPLELEKSVATQQAEADSTGGTGGGDGSTQRALGWVAVGGGVALGVLSIVFLAEHNHIVSEATDACPGGNCTNKSNESIALSHQSGANTTSALSVGFLIGAVAVGGTGLALVLTAKSAPAQVALHPGAPGSLGGGTVAVTF